MTLEQIKAAIAAGLKVCWKTGSYVVTGSGSDYLITFGKGSRHENSIGLTWKDGCTMNGDPKDFYVHADCISFAVDTALAEVHPVGAEMFKNARYVGFKAGFEMTWVAVGDYLGTTPDVGEACELAIDLLREKKWFADESKTEPWVVI